MNPALITCMATQSHLPLPSLHAHSRNCFLHVFFAGVGAGGGAVIYGELARTSTKKERTAIISLFVTLRHIGFIIGMPDTTTQYTNPLVCCR